nr:MAG TPA: hypothetical protein [Caudoviricetes sp.]
MWLQFLSLYLLCTFIYNNSIILPYIKSIYFKITLIYRIYHKLQCHRYYFINNCIYIVV